jgi:dTDP-6-deoxy-L-talose 4-dehydrogenase (NAD+)
MINDKQNILITGSAGFIGSHLIKFFDKKEYNVFLGFHKKKPLTKKFRKIKINFDNIRNINFQHLKKLDILIHLAWSNLNNYHHSSHIETNLELHKKFLSKIINLGCKNIVVAGTCYEYGKKFGKISENIILKPEVKYAIGKNNLRKFLVNKQKKHFFNLSWLRLFFIYGKKQQSNSLTNVLIKSSKNKETVFLNSKIKRDYMSVNDVAKIIARISIKNKNLGVINICSGKPIKLKELVKIVKKKYNIKPKVSYNNVEQRIYEAQSFYGCNKKLNKILSL